MVTVGELDLAIYRGKKGTKKKESDLEEMQLILEQNLRDFMACPTCTQLSTGRTWVRTHPVHPFSPTHCRDPHILRESSGETHRFDL